MIHPTAIIHPDARLGSEVSIGPYTCIEGPAEIGSGCVIEAHVSLVGSVRMGLNNRIGHGTVIGGWPQDLSFKPTTESGVEIGEDNVIREHCTIHRGTAPGSVTRVGNRNLLMAGVHLGHNANVGNYVIIANNSLLGGFVEVGDHAFIGGGSVFHQHVRVGQRAMLQGNSAFSKDMPPFSLGALLNLVFGLNVVGLRRAGYTAAERAEIKAAFRLLYLSGLNISQALERSREQTWGAAATHFFEFAAGAKKRGLGGLGRRKGAAKGSASVVGDI